MLSKKGYKRSMLNSKYFIKNFFGSSGDKFKFEQEFIMETKKIGDYSDFKDVLAYLNSFKVFDNTVLKEIFRKKNFKKFKIELIQWVFECSEKNFQELKEKMTQKLKILRLFHQTRRIKAQVKERVDASLSHEVDWDVFDRLVLDFESVLKSVSKEMRGVFQKRRVRSEDVGFFF
jgi:uncharacterized protein YkvS